MVSTVNVEVMAWTNVYTEASLAQLEAVQARLAQDVEAIQAEIDELRAELQRDQDPQKMQLIQEMISVCMALLHGLSSVPAQTMTRLF